MTFAAFGRITFPKIGLIERTLDPVARSDIGQTYTKEVAPAGRTELFYEDDDGQIIQLTINGAINGAAIAPPTRFEQTFAVVTVVNVNHGLGAKPVVSVIDDDATPNEIIPDEIEHIDDDNVRVTFSGVQTGTVICISGGSGLVSSPPPLPDGAIYEAKLTYVSAEAVSIGTTGRRTIARSGDNTLDMGFTGLLTADITVSGVGGLDAGAGAEAVDTWYAVHIIGDSTGVNAPAALLSTNQTSPTFPAGYDKSRRVGWVRNNSSSDFFKFFQTGVGSYRNIEYDESVEPGGVLRVLSGGSAVVFTDVDCSEFIPPTSGLGILRAVTLSNRDAMLRPDTSTAIDGTRRVVGNTGSIYLQMAAPGQIIEYSNQSGGGPAGSVDIDVLGWIDEL